MLSCLLLGVAARVFAFNCLVNIIWHTPNSPLVSSIGYSFSSGAGNRVKEFCLKPVKDAAIFLQSSLLAALLEPVLKDINVRSCFAARGSSWVRLVSTFASPCDQSRSGALGCGICSWGGINRVPGGKPRWVSWKHQRAPCAKCRSQAQSEDGSVPAYSLWGELVQRKKMSIFREHAGGERTTRKPKAIQKVG